MIILNNNHLFPSMIPFLALNMTQEEIFDFLKKNLNWYSAAEIADKLKYSVGSVQNNLRRLRKTGLIKIQYKSILKNQKYNIILYKG